MVEAACGALPSVSATAEELQWWQTCAMHWLALHAESVTPGAEFLDALPFVALFVIFGIGYRVGVGL
jgi:hypothetical protein